VISTLRFIGICMLTCSLVGLVSAQTFYKEKSPIEAQLERSVDKGMTIDEAVAQSIIATPNNGEAITKTALSIYKKLPRTACAIRAKDGGRRITIWPDFKACGGRIVDAAIKAGADPTKITSASAAGSLKSNQASQSASDRSAHKTSESDLYILHILRQIFLAGTN